MKGTSSDSPAYIDRIRSWARAHAHGGSTKSDQPVLPLTNPQASSSKTSEKDGSRSDSNGNPSVGNGTDLSGHNLSAPNSNDAHHAAGAASQPERPRSVLAPEPKKANVASRFFTTGKKIVFHSWVNVLLIFVPVGIAVAQIPGMPPGAIFGINAVAIIPLAGLLSHATESVARRLGDTIGALLNVTFGNAVELIIFIIALVKNEIRVVQASLLGSILANLLLILGMSFFFGGLRFREQIYNSTVTQMSACLLSLSVISLVLPTAFHASWANSVDADRESLKISRGTSVILLLVYGLYLAFQLKSHAYMYESTPQHIIDEESVPGPAAAWLDDTSSESSSNSDTDSDGSSRSGNTVSKRVKRAIRNRRRRKSSVTSLDTHETAGTPSIGTNNASPLEAPRSADGAGGPFARMNTAGSEEVIEEEPSKGHGKRRNKHSKRKQRKQRLGSIPVNTEENIPGQNSAAFAQDGAAVSPSNGDPRRVDFADTVQGGDGPADGMASNNRRPYVRGFSFKPVKNLAPSVFTQPPNAPGQPLGPFPAGPVPRVKVGIRRTNSLPDRLNQQQPVRPSGLVAPTPMTLTATAENENEVDIPEDDLSRTASIVMLLISTGLVAACAEFMVDSINDVVATTGLKEIFIGLIILPIVGNAAEHVTALTVAMKNKMDLAIGVAVGSSIQIALFITPLVVILGWIIDREMTLYFTLFETVCLFVSTFIVNFLVLDGRSNYLEGALLCCTYVIIGLVAFFYPQGDQASEWAAQAGSS